MLNHVYLQGRVWERQLKLLENKTKPENRALSLVPQGQRPKAVLFLPRTLLMSEYSPGPESVWEGWWWPCFCGLGRGLWPWVTASGKPHWVPPSFTPYFNIFLEYFKLNLRLHKNLFKKNVNIHQVTLAKAKPFLNVLCHAVNLRVRLPKCPSPSFNHYEHRVNCFT